jgi:hypothetical protein
MILPFRRATILLMTANVCGLEHRSTLESAGSSTGNSLRCSQFEKHFYPQSTQTGRENSSHKRSDANTRRAALCDETTDCSSQME